MKNLVPQFILSNYNKHNFSGNFRAFTLLLDISGFTNLTECLMENGKEGAEEITSKINDIFSPAIDLIYQYGGFISTFGGDAFTAIFKDSQAEKVLESSLKIQQLFIEKNIIKTKFGSFPIHAKIGLSFGNISWLIINNDVQKVYYFKGNAILNCSESEKYAGKNQIIFDKAFSDKSQHLNLCFNSLNNDFYMLEKYEFYKKANSNSNPINFSFQDSKMEFYPETIYSLNIKGEFRHVVSMFIAFEDTLNINSKLSEIISHTHKLGGYFNRISFGDKGSFILIFFGAPLSREKGIQRACELALTVKNMNDLKTKIGMTFGNAFTGFSGSDLREEYTCQSSKVNLAARFMLKADFNEILVDEEIKNQTSGDFSFSKLLINDFKGFNYKINYYKLSNKKRANETHIFENKLVGRIQEIQILKNAIKPVYDEDFAGIIYVDGNAGIGKSRLIEELRRQIPENVYWIKAPCDELHKTALNPIKYFLNNYFEQDLTNPTEKNITNFENKLSELVESTPENYIKNELIRTKSFLAALLNLYWENSLYEKVDSKGKQANTFSAIKNLIKAESLRKPVLINLEDGHWIDSETLKFLDVLVTNIQNYPIAIITSCRLNDDGSFFDFNLKNIGTTRISLDSISKIETSLFINELINNTIPEKSLDFIFQKSEGNPFYIEQIVLFLLENSFFDMDYNLVSKNFEIPASINAIITSRIDKLTHELKEVVKTASVLGKEFTIKILTKMLNKKSIDSYLETGKKQAIWVALNELSYLFKHALIRETVYQMQLKTRLRKLHELAGDTIEQLFPESLHVHYDKLADHYYKSENFNKAIDYLEKAGDQAKEKYQNEKALDFYDKLIELLENKLKDHT